MKKVLLTLVLVLCMAGASWATSVTFTPNVSASSVSVTDNANWGNMKGTLALAATPFTLADNTTQTLDFFTLTATGLAWNKDYTVSATLAFSDPNIAGLGTGGGDFFTFFGLLYAGNLTWDTTTIPACFTLADGNNVKIDFQNGLAIGVGGTAMIHAYVTNQGGAAVPEPATMLLFGLGLIGVAGIRRKLKK